MTLSDLINLSNKTDWGSINKILTSKGWEFRSAGEYPQYSAISWRFKNEDITKSLDLDLYMHNDIPYQLDYTVYNKNANEVLKKALASSGFVEINNAYNEYALIYTYSKDSYVIRASEVIWEPTTKKYDFAMKFVGYEYLKFESNW